MGINVIRIRITLFATAFVVALMIEPAAAHHVMGGQMPRSFAEGLLSGLGHPIIGLDHLAAIVAVGCVAAAFRNGAALAISFVVAMVIGAALHVREVTFPAAEALVALSVLTLGAAAMIHRTIGSSLALVLFVVAGLVHGYALAESIVGAEPTPLYAYLAGLVAIQSAAALAVMAAVRTFANRTQGRDIVRLVGAVIVGIGLGALVQQLVTGA
jgi:urease accessory protein